MMAGLREERAGKHRTRVRTAFSSFLFVSLLLLGACSTTTIEPEFVASPLPEIDTIAIGEITSKQRNWTHHLPHLRLGLVNMLENSTAFAEVLETAPEPLPANAVLITGKLTTVDNGSWAARAFIGFGAGRAKARGEFQIRSPTGVILAKFKSWKAYAGGIGIGGGATLVSMEELVEQLGEETANSVIRWYRGEPLKPPKKKQEPRGGTTVP